MNKFPTFECCHPLSSHRNMFTRIILVFYFLSTSDNHRNNVYLCRRFPLNIESINKYQGLFSHIQNEKYYMLIFKIASKLSEINF